jgi:MoaA/NifB/PqqE/SkfB family radical SAM enzyme
MIPTEIESSEIRQALDLTPAQAISNVQAAKDRASCAFQAVSRRPGAPWHTFDVWFKEAVLESGNKPANEQLAIWLRAALRFEAMADPYRWPGTYLAAGEIVQGRPVMQLFRSQADTLPGMAISVATYQAIQNCHLTLALYEISAWRAALIQLIFDESRRSFGSRAIRKLIKFSKTISFFERCMLAKNLIIAKVTEACDSVPDNSPVQLFVNPPRSSRGKLYLLKISSADGIPGTAVTVWLHNGPERIEEHVWCSVGGKNMGEYGVIVNFPLSNALSASPTPPALLISTTTQCNLNCIHCISRSTRDRVNRLSPDIRARIKWWADQGLLETVATDYSGDILWADQRFGDDLDFFLSLNVPYQLVTNGVCLNREVSQRLMRSRILSVNVSLDAARDETYRRIRVGAPALAEVVSNMRVLAEERDRAGRTDVRLSTSLSLMQSNIDELPEAIKLARDVGFNVLFTTHVQAYTPDIIPESLWHDKPRFNEARERALALAEKLGVELTIPPPFSSCAPRRGHTFCAAPWESRSFWGMAMFRPVVCPDQRCVWVICTNRAWKRFGMGRGISSLGPLLIPPIRQKLVTLAPSIEWKTTLKVICQLLPEGGATQTPALKPASRARRRDQTEEAAANRGIWVMWQPSDGAWGGTLVVSLNIYIEDRFAPCVLGNQIEQRIIVVRPTPQGRMGFVVILGFMDHSDLVILFIR